MNLKILGVCSAVMLLYGGDIFAKNEVDTENAEFSGLSMENKIKRWNSTSSLTSRNTSNLGRRFSKSTSTLNSIEEDEIDPIERSSTESTLVDDEKNVDTAEVTSQELNFDRFSSGFDELKKESASLTDQVKNLNDIKSPEKQIQKVPVLKEKLEDHKNKVDKMIDDLNKLQTWLEEFNVNKKIDELNSSKSAIDTIRQEIARKQLALWENKIKSYRKSLSQFWNSLQNYKVSRDKISSGAKKCFGDASNASKLFDLNSFDSQMFDISGVNIREESKKNIINDWEEICNNLYPKAERALSELIKLSQNDPDYNGHLTALREIVSAFHDKVQSLLGKYTDKGERRDVRGVAPHDLQKKRQKLKKAETNSSKRALAEGLKRQRSRMTGGGE